MTVALGDRLLAEVLLAVSVFFFRTAGGFTFFSAESFDFDWFLGAVFLFFVMIILKLMINLF